MRILFCNYEYPPLGGGGGVINALLAEEMAKHHEVTVLTSQGFDLPRQRVENDVKVVRVPVFFRKQEAVANIRSMAAYILVAIKEGRKLLKDNQFDVINTHFVLPTGPVGDILSQLGGIPNVLSLHGGDLYDPSKSYSPHRHVFLRFVVRQLLRRADMVLGQSRNTLANMRRFYTPEIEGVRIPLAIKRPDFEPAARADYGFDEDETLLVTVGRLVPRKSIEQLIAMMEGFKDQKVRLLIVGSGPEEASLRREVAHRQLAAQVQFTGFVEEAEKFRLLQLSDLYVSTSQHEGFGLVFLEAMACGLPVVCYDHGGQTDFLCDEHNGYLVSLNDLELFTSRCRALINDVERRRTIGDNNLSEVQEFFIDRCAAKHEDVFEEAISLRPGLQRARSFQQRTA